MADRALQTAMKTVVARPPSYPAQIQRAVFDAKLQRGDGSQMDFSTLRGKVIVLNVWATWCPPCMAELPSLAKLAAHYAGKEDLRVMCVSAEQVSKVWPKMATHEAASILYCTDGHRLPAVYETSAIPATFIINKGGEIVFQHVGMANWDNEETFKFIDKLRVNGFTPPRLLNVVPPKYPDLAGKEHPTGAVVVSFVVDSGGHVREPRVLNSTNKLFDAPALESVQQWKFEPGIRDGKPVDMKMQVPIEFSPTEKPNQSPQPTPPTGG